MPESVDVAMRSPANCPDHPVELPNLPDRDSAAIHGHLLNVEEEMTNVAILHDIGLSLNAQLPHSP